MLKKISLIVSFVFLALIAIGFTTSPVFAEADYQIYVHDIKTDKPSYTVGETVKGEFVISNLANTAQSDIMYEISSGLYDSAEMSLTTKQGISPKLGPIYIKSQSKITIPFEYKLPESLTGKSAIQVIAVLKDGTFVGQGYAPVAISGKATVEHVPILASGLKLNNDNKLIVVPNTGPTVYKGETLEFSYIVSPTTKKYTFTPTLDLYNRADNSNALVKTIELPKIETGKKSTEAIVKLPVSLDPLVYYGVISFKTLDKAELADTSFRYIIAGPIATIRNVTSNVLEAKAGMDIPFEVTYGLQPLDELRPGKQVKLDGATISVVVTNENGENVGVVDSQLDLSKGEISLSVLALAPAKSLSYSAVIKDLTGKILSEYKTNLPTNDSVKDQKSYLSKSGYSLITLICAIILLITIIILIYMRVKHKIVNMPLTILAFVFLLATLLLGARDAKAWEFYMGHIFSGSGHTGMFRVTSVTSPVPDTIKSYAPGEPFNLSFKASYGDCSNDSEYFYAYVYKTGIDWWSQTPDLKQTTNWVSDYTANKAYWASKGTELLTANGFLSSSNKFNVSTKALCNSAGLPWVTLFGQGKCLQPDIFAKTYSFSKQYTAPTTPGYHKMYFAIFQKGDDHGGNNVGDGHQNATYVQTICVTGAGLCYGEQTNDSACPNLSGAYTLSNGTIYDPDGEETTLIQDSSGNCVEDIADDDSNDVLCGDSDGTETSIKPANTSANPNNLCYNSNPTVVETKVDRYSWKCNGTTTPIETVSCEALFPTVECGPADGSGDPDLTSSSADLCESGASQIGFKTIIPNVEFSWKCKDSAGIFSSQCSSSVIEDSIAKCGTADGSGKKPVTNAEYCESGSKDAPAVQGSDGYWAWSCVGGDLSSEDCSSFQEVSLCEPEEGFYECTPDGKGVVNNCGEVVPCEADQTCVSGACVDGNTGINDLASCTLDGITVPNGGHYKFYQSRISSVCIGKDLYCYDGSWKTYPPMSNPESIYKFRTCVAPRFREF